MTVAELIALLQQQNSNAQVLAVGPDCGGYDAVIDADVRVIARIDGSIVVVGVGDYENPIFPENIIERWVND